MADKKKGYFVIDAAAFDGVVMALADIGGKILLKKEIKFPAGKMKLLRRINDFFIKQGIEFSDVRGIIIVSGPGSFTSIRTGLSVINTWSNITSIPAVGFSRQEFATFEDLAAKGSVALRKIKHLKIIQPFYGRPPNITKPKEK